MPAPVPRYEKPTAAGPTSSKSILAPPSSPRIPARMAHYGLPSRKARRSRRQGKAEGQTWLPARAGVAGFLSDEPAPRRFARPAPTRTEYPQRSAGFREIPEFESTQPHSNSRILFTLASRGTPAPQKFTAHRPRTTPVFRMTPRVHPTPLVRSF